MRNYLMIIVIVGIIASAFMLTAHAAHIEMQPLVSKQKPAKQDLPITTPLALTGKFATEITMSEGIPGPRRARKPAPVNVNACNMTTMDERVGCRLATNISQLQYLPEGCRIQPARLQDKCRELYGHTHKCLALKDVARRSVCMQKEANLQSIKAEHISCTRGRVNVTQCMQILHLRVDNLIAQSMYMLELRAIEFHQRNGAPSSIVQPFLKKMEGHILAYSALRKREDKIKTIKAAEKDWDAFVTEAKSRSKRTIGPHDVDSYLTSRIDMLQELSS